MLDYPTNFELGLFVIDSVFCSASKLHKISGSARIHVNSGQLRGQASLFVI